MELLHFIEKAHPSLIHDIVGIPALGCVWTLSENVELKIWKWKGSTASEPALGKFDVRYFSVGCHPHLFLPHPRLSLLASVILPCAILTFAISCFPLSAGGSGARHDAEFRLAALLF